MQMMMMAGCFQPRLEPFTDYSAKGTRLWLSIGPLHQRTVFADFSWLPNFHGSKSILDEIESLEKKFYHLQKTDLPLSLLGPMERTLAR